MSDLPDRVRDKPPNVERRLTNRDFELVIRRAAELQAKEAEGPDADGIEEGEVLRIGRELGLSTQHLHRALVEVSGDRTIESGFFTRVFGPANVRAGRTVRGSPGELAALLEKHLVDREYLVVLRRLPDRVLYTRAQGVAAALGRATSQMVNRSPLLAVSNLEVAVHPLEEGFSFVNLATSLAKDRNATAAGSLLGGGTGTAFAAATLGIAIAPPAALLALPILGGSMYGGKVYYRNLVTKVQVQMESLLDRVEHGELTKTSPRRTLPWG